MMKLLRKHRDWLMIVIAILAIPFIFYFVQRPDYGAMRSDRFARIYDRNVSMLEAQQMVRLLTLAQALGMSDFVQTLTAGAGMNPDQTAVQFIVNLLVLRHEAAQLGIRPGYSEIAEVVRTLPAFQGDSGFDMKKFSDFAQNALAPMGLAEEHIEQLVGDQLSLNQIKRLLAAGITVPKGELDENFERGHDTLFVTVIRFHAADFGKDIQVSDEDVQKHYDAHKAELKTDEKRKVEFVSLALTDEEKKLTGKERIEVLQKLSDRATDFTQALLEKGDFKQAALKFQLPVHETGEFTKAEPDPQLKVDTQLGAAAFKLSTQEPNSDPIQVADGFYILHLAGITEARPLTLEEAKPKIVDTIKKSKARELMSTKGAEVVQQLREAKQSGQPLEAAIQKAGGKAEKVPPFSLIEEEKPKSQANEPKKNGPADLLAIKQAVAFLNRGETSDFFPAGENGFIAVLEKREPLTDANAAEKKAAFEKRLLDNKRRVVLLEWLRDRGQAAGLQFTKG
jgi:SurA-like protein/parvulin-like peptidyl-prolyl cis-trans isomerase-like protein